MKMKIKNKNNIKKYKVVLVGVATLLFIKTPIVRAADDPLSVINNLSNFIFEIVRAVGGIMIVFGLVQFGMSFKSQDPSQRASSVFTILGGSIIAFSKEILAKIMG